MDMSVLQNIAGVTKYRTKLEDYIFKTNDRIVESYGRGTVQCMIGFMTS